MYVNEEDDIEDCFGSNVISIRAILEMLEAKLLETGLDEINIATTHGTWTWQPRPN